MCIYCKYIFMYIHIYIYIWLVVATPLKILVSWDDDSQLNGKIKHVPNHQPDMCGYHTYYLYIYIYLNIYIYIYMYINKNESLYIYIISI